MIRFYTNSTEFNNDLFNLARAFYPFSKVEVSEINYPNEVLEDKEGKFLNSSDFDLTFIIFMNEQDVKVKAYSVNRVEYEASEDVAYLDRKFYRNALKRLVYLCFSKISGKSLWGTLTGVRPTKIVLDKLENGESKESIRAYMKAQYLCSNENRFKHANSGKRTYLATRYRL